MGDSGDVPGNDDSTGDVIPFPLPDRDNSKCRHPSAPSPTSPGPIDDDDPEYNYDYNDSPIDFNICPSCGHAYYHDDNGCTYYYRTPDYRARCGCHRIG